MALMRVLSRNVIYFRQQFSALLGNTSQAVKFICLIVIFGYILSFSDVAVQILSVTPGYLIPPNFQIWSAFTFWFLELHFWEVIIDVVTIGLCGKLIEPLWGQMEMISFFVLMNMGVAFMTTFYYLVIYACTGDASYLFEIHVHGLAGYIAAVSVAVKQILPDHLIIKTPLGKLTNRLIPLLVLLAAVIVWTIGGLEGTYPCMWACGVLFAWLYLRYWQRHNNGTRGDIADNFSFDNFFPTVMQPAVRTLLRPIHRCFVKLGVIPPSQRRVHLALSTRGVTIAMPGVEPQDMERRRQIALKALSERLSKTSELSKQKSASTSVNMDPTMRKSQQVVPQFVDSTPSAAVSESTHAVSEAILVDIPSDPAATPTDKHS